MTGVHDDGTVGVRDVDLHRAAPGSWCCCSARSVRASPACSPPSPGWSPTSGAISWNGHRVADPEVFLRPGQVRTSRRCRACCRARSPTTSASTTPTARRRPAAPWTPPGWPRRRRGRRPDAVVGHRGVRLSGGQVQRLALARALATGPSCCSPTTSPRPSTPPPRSSCGRRCAARRDGARRHVEARRPRPGRPGRRPGRRQGRGEGPGATSRRAGATSPADAGADHAPHRPPRPVGVACHSGAHGILWVAFVVIAGPPASWAPISSTSCAGGATRSSGWSAGPPRARTSPPGTLRRPGRPRAGGQRGRRGDPGRRAAIGDPHSTSGPATSARAG